MIGVLILAGLAALGVSNSGGGALPEASREATASTHAVVPLGKSTKGRPIRARVIEGATEGPAILVIGCVHGTECAGTEVVRAMRPEVPAAGEIVAVPNLNPDGSRLGTRVNARGVDLNRNFRSEWRPIGAPGDPEHSGPRPFSEAESRLARRLIRQLRPKVTIWFHQHLDPPIVRAWGGSAHAARAYARLAGSPYGALPWLPGTAPNWQNHRFDGTSSFVVELASGNVSRAVVARHANAVLGLGRELRRGGA